MECVRLLDTVQIIIKISFNFKVKVVVGQMLLVATLLDTNQACHNSVVCVASGQSPGPSGGSTRVPGTNLVTTCA